LSSYDEEGQDPLRADQDGIRARSEQAIGELAQALIESPTVHNAIAAAFGAREKVIEAQHAAMSALDLPTAGDVERLERRLRSLSQRLEEAEEQLDGANREIGTMRRQLAAERAEKAEKPEKAEKSEPKAAKKAKAAKD
jgi:chromosome segregation ATPase